MCANELEVFVLGFSICWGPPLFLFSSCLSSFLLSSPFVSSQQQPQSLASHADHPCPWSVWASVPHSCLRCFLQVGCQSRCHAAWGPSWSRTVLREGYGQVWACPAGKSEVADKKTKVGPPGNKGRVSPTQSRGSSLTQRWEGGAG